MRKRRSINSSSLSFLDIMACGLGAMILLFFILDFKEVREERPFEKPQANKPEISQDSKAAISKLKDRERVLLSRIDEASKRLATAIESEIQLGIVSDSLMTKERKKKNDSLER